MDGGEITKKELNFALRDFPREGWTCEQKAKWRKEEEEARVAYLRSIVGNNENIWLIPMGEYLECPEMVDMGDCEDYDMILAVGTKSIKVISTKYSYMPWEEGVAYLKAHAKKSNGSSQEE